MNRSLVLVSVGVCGVLSLTAATQAGGPGMMKPGGGQNNGFKQMGFPGGMKKDGMGVGGMKKDGMAFPGMMNKGNKSELGNFSKPQNAGQKDFGKGPAAKDEARKKNLGTAPQNKNHGDNTEEKQSNGNFPSKEGKSTKPKK